jgi:HlyD family type I secretion membrane fusion protein
MTDLHRPSHDIRRVATIGITVIVLTFGVIGLWAALVPLGSAVIGHGTVSVDSNRQTIQHYDGGIVRRILVHEGDHVRAGQVLFELNPVQADATLESARNQLFSLLAKADRLAAERDNRPSVTFSDEVRAQSAIPVVARAMADETRQFQERRATIADQVAVLNTRIAEYKTAIGGIDEQRASMQQQVALLDDEIGGLSALYQKDLVPKPRILALQRERSQLQGQIGGSIAEKAKTQESIGETQIQINQLHQQFYQDVSKDFSDAQTQSADLRQRFAVAQDAARRVSILAPMDGVVQNLKVTTVGGVVRSGEPLVDIAPDQGNMIVEARFSPNDVDSVHPGQPVQIRFSTFHSRTVPVISGTIRTVSRDRLSDEATHTSYYLAIVDVPDSHLPVEIRGKLRAGLPAEIVAPTGTRTALQYAFGPLSSALSGTMRER